MSKICIELNQDCDFLNLENNLVVNTEHVLCGFYFHVVLKAILRDLLSPVQWFKTSMRQSAIIVENLCAQQQWGKQVALKRNTVVAPEKYFLKH